jgi:hypothetical protein
MNLEEFIENNVVNPKNIVDRLNLTYYGKRKINGSDVPVYEKMGEHIVLLFDEHREIHELAVDLSLEEMKVTILPHDGSQYIEFLLLEKKDGIYVNTAIKKFSTILFKEFKSKSIWNPLALGLTLNSIYFVATLPIYAMLEKYTNLSLFGQNQIDTTFGIATAAGLLIACAFSLFPLLTDSTREYRINNAVKHAFYAALFAVNMYATSYLATTLVH